MPARADAALTKAEFEALSEFRFQIRRFERFSEDAVQSAGITPLQYLLLLHVKGFPGREWATVGELATRLQAKPHGVVALVTRCEEHGFVERRPSASDRRLTRSLRDTLALVDVQLLDHLVIGTQDTFSFARNGWD